MYDKKNLNVFFFFFQPFINFSNASWGTPDSSQYHIQTDEGPER
jgi:hypothetical protein